MATEYKKTDLTNVSTRTTAAFTSDEQTRVNTELLSSLIYLLLNIVRIGRNWLY